MKKYLTGFLAIILAVGFSAFTAPQKEKSNLNNFYWYAVDGTRTETVGSYLRHDTEAGMIQNSDCKDQDQPLCLVGFPTQVSPGEDVTGITDEGRLINEDNPIK